MECLKFFLAGCALLAALRDGHAAPSHHIVLRPPDKRSVADPDVGLQRLAGLGGISMPPAYIGQGIAYYPGHVPLPLATAGLDAFDVPAMHYDLTAFHYLSAATAFGFDASTAPLVTYTAVDERPVQSGGPEGPYPAADVRPSLKQQQQQPQRQQLVEPAADLALELRPPSYSASSGNTYVAWDVAQQMDVKRDVGYESVPSVSYSPPASVPPPTIAPVDPLPVATPHDVLSPAPAAGHASTRGNVVIVVSNGLYGGESDASGHVVDSDPSHRPSLPPSPQPTSPTSYANSNSLSANSYGDSNSIPDHSRVADDNGDGYYGGPKIVITGTGSDSNSKPAVRYSSSPDGYQYASNNVTPRD